MADRWSVCAPAGRSRDTVTVMPALSVIIPTFNTAAMTLRCCRAVVSSMPDAEVIVVDDGSTDGTAKLLGRELPSVQIVMMTSNSGYAKAANRGVGVATGGVLLLLNSDAIVESDALQDLVDAFAKSPELGVAGARLVEMDGTPQWSGGRTPTLPWMIGVVSGAGRVTSRFRQSSHSAPARDIDWVSGAAMAFRREVWNVAGPLDERFRFYCQDIAFSLRAREFGWHVAIIETARVAHEIGATVAPSRELRHDPARLWPALLDWGRQHYGRRWVLSARVALTSVAWLRVLFRSVYRRDETTAALVRGARALTFMRHQRIDS